MAPADGRRIVSVWRQSAGDMSDKTITLKLQGGVSVETFAAAMVHFQKLVAGLCADAKAKGMPWTVSDLQAGSATVTVRADLSNGFTETQADVVVSSYERVGRDLAEHEGLSGYSARVRRPALALAEIATLKVEEVVFETAEVDVLIRAPRQLEQVAALSEAIPFPTAALGSVTGRVQSLSNRGGLRFTIYEVLSDRAVSCYLSSGSEDTMLGIWGKLATVYGEVSRDAATGRPIAIRQISSVDPHDECETEKYKKARGAVVPLTGSELPEDIIRRLRDAN